MAYSHHTLGERLTVEIPVGLYNGIEGGLYVVDIQGAGLFMPRPEIIRGQIKRGELKRGAYAVQKDDTDLLFGEQRAWRFNGKEVETVPVQFFDSYDTFLEASSEPSFLDSTPVYAVLRSAEKARQNPHGWEPINQQLGRQLVNPDLIIPAGGKAPLHAMLIGKKGQPRFGWNQVGSYNGGYQVVNSGRGLEVMYHNQGVDANFQFNARGYSLGVEPVALTGKDGLERAFEVARGEERSYYYDGRLTFPIARGVRAYDCEREPDFWELKAKHKW